MTRLTLTFDNGPTPGVTERVLAALQERDLAATFFLVGNRLGRPGARQIAERTREAGHWIGNHTMNHSLPFGERPTDDPGLDELVRAQDVLGSLACTPPLFRPNGHGRVGSHLLNRTVLDHLIANRFTVVLWSIFVDDRGNPDGWVERALEAIEEQEWGLLVAHDLPSGAMDALPELLDTALARGVEIVQEFPPSCTPIVDGQPADGYERILPV